MSQRQTALVCGLLIALTMCLSNSSYAAIPYIQTPYNRNAPNVTYGTTAGDYQSWADLNGVSNPPGTNDLALGSVAQGSAGGPIGLGNSTIGFGELITPMTNSVYGAPNNHAFKVNTITAPLGGNTTSPLTVTLEILSGFLTNGDGITPVAPNHNGITDSFAQQSVLFSDTFIWNNPGSDFNATMLTTFDLSSSNVTFNLDQTYLIGFKWSSPSGTRNNELLIDRGLGLPHDPGGQGVALHRPSDGWLSLANLQYNGAARSVYIAINVPEPEPASLAMLGLALPALFCAARRRNLKAASPRRAKLGRNPMTD